MKSVNQTTPKINRYRSRESWRPGQPIPKDRQPDAWGALQRNAIAAEQHDARLAAHHRGDLRRAA